MNAGELGKNCPWRLAEFSGVIEGLALLGMDTDRLDGDSDGDEAVEEAAEGAVPAAATPFMLFTEVSAELLSPSLTPSFLSPPAIPVPLTF